MKLVLSISCALVFMGMACQTPLEKSLQLAGKNKKELKKALHYFKSDVDPKKYEAIRFLIEHMPGHYATDTGHLHEYRPFLPEATLIISTYAAGVEQTEALKTAWQNYKQEKVPVSASLKIQHDCRVVRSQFLIDNCNQAFDAWETNAFYKNGSFENFLEYVLPYRRANGLPIENWRLHFTSKYADILSKYTGNNLLTVCDSLLYALRHLKHHQYAMSDYPLLKVADFETLKRGLCQHKCWYNSMFFASLGIPCAIDFVPAWGNRNAAHSWNVILRGNESFAFEPYWDTDRWKYKRIYNNASWDDEWGKFRLPKVYRHTYSSHIDGPIANTRVNAIDIPPLFKNIKQKDVSKEYFEAHDITLQLDDPVPSDTYYCYLCVFNYQKWTPVQWGKIVNGKVKFKDMGKDIVYLPCYYKSGQVIPAGEPFLFTHKATIKKLIPKKEKVNIFLKRTSFQYPMYGDGVLRLKKAYVEAANDIEFKSKEKLCSFPDTMLYQSKMSPVNTKHANQYVRLVFPSDTFAIADLKFWRTDKNGNYLPIQGTVISSFSDADTSYIRNAFDGRTTNGWFFNDKSKFVTTTSWIGLDFGEPVKISAISYCPVMMSNLKNKVDFELFFWQDGWKNIALKTGNDYELLFKQVPKGALLLLKNQDSNMSERIFIYEDGEQKWH